MAILGFPLANHGPTERPATITVEPGDDRTVWLTIGAETHDDLAVERTLTVGEARAFAAALVHFADQADS